MGKNKKCCVASCNGQGDVPASFHEFPANLVTRQKWLNNIFSCGDQPKLSDYTLVCSLHFEESCFKITSAGCRRLEKDAVPTIFVTSLPSTSFSDPSFNPDLNIANDINKENVSTEFKELQKCRDEIKKLKRKVKILTEQHQLNNKKLQEQQQVIDDSLHIIIKKIKNDAENHNSFAVFLLDQILNYNKKKPKWSELTLRHCVMWRIISPKGYEQAKSSFLKIPCRSTLSQYTSSTLDSFSLIEARLNIEAAVLKPIEKVCSLIIDDMAIQEKLYYNKMEDKFFGLQNIDTDETIGAASTLANKMLCYVIHGLSTKFTIPVGYFFHKTLDMQNFYELTINILKKVHECGFIAIRIVTDNHKSNVALFRLLGNGQISAAIPHPLNSSIPLFLSYDYCHAIKNARNIFLDHDMACEEGIITSNHLKNLYFLQKDMIVKPVRNLTRKHLYPTNFEKMNVRRAIDIFRPDVTAALKYLSTFVNNSRYDFSAVKATVSYMETIYTFFTIHDVSDRVQYIKTRDEMTAPYGNVNDDRLKWMLETFPVYIDSIQSYSKAYKMKGLTKETADALKFTAESTARCIKYLLNDSQFYYVLTRSFNSDAIESTFSHIRMKNGAQDMTDAFTADNAIKRILKCGLMKTAISANVASNCSYVSNVGCINDQLSSNIPSTSHHENYIHLDSSVLQMINGLSSVSPNINYGISSASTAYLAGYLVRIVEEKLNCHDCLKPISTTSSTSSPLLALIYFQDRGALKYPTRDFAQIVNQIIAAALAIIEYLPANEKAIDTLTTLLLPPLTSCKLLTCTSHAENLVEIILIKLLRPLMANIAQTKTNNLARSSRLSTKPLSRKILKL